MEIDVDKLEHLFDEKYKVLVVDGNSDATYENWVGYCDKHNILLLHPEWMRDTLNDNGMRGKVCVHSPESDHEASPWLLVPLKLAEKAMVLGFLP